MTTLPLFAEAQPSDDHTPFPIFIAKRFNFPLAYHECGDEIYYAIQDWVKGLIGANDVTSIISNIKKANIYDTISDQIRKLPYMTANRKLQKRAFTTSRNLILIMQYLRQLNSRPILVEAKRLFIERLILRYNVRLASQPVKTIFDYDIDQLDLDIEDWESDDFLQYRISEKEIEFYENYFKSKIQPHLLDYFVGRTKDEIKPQYYDILTVDIYKGLWKRTPEQLKIQIGAPKVYSMKLYMPSMAHSFHNLVCEAIKIRLSHKSLYWYEIRYSVKETATLVGRMAKEMSEFMKMDLATGRPLLAHG